MRWSVGHGISADDIARAIGTFAPTADQRKVIEAPPEPTLVIAGAGSGKTETMSARVLWLVANGHVRADHILGLTFTRKAAGELSERIAHRLAELAEFGQRGLLPYLPQIVASDEFARIGGASDAARAAIRRDVLDGFVQRFDTRPDDGVESDELLNRPTVSTYNAFADRIVRENAARIGRDPDAGMLSDSAAWVIARSVAVRADDAGLDEVERSLGQVVQGLRSLSDDILDNRASIDALRRYAAELCEQFAPFVAKPGAQGRKYLAAHAAMAAIPALTELVERYQAEKLRRGVLEFADQVSGALEVVERAPDVVADLRDQYRVVLLDEYQDTSVLQARLLSALFRDSAVMAVGDPNQAIYGWRGASADGIHAFARDFARDTPAHEYTLMTSWRNDAVVLTAANRLVRPFARAGGGSERELGTRADAGEGTLDVRFPVTIDEEADATAEWFAEQRGRRAEGAPSPTGAILFRAKRHMQRFADALTARGVPHRILGLGGLLEIPEIVDVVSALRVIHDPAAGSALIRLLVGPRFAVGIADMGALYDLASELSHRDEALSPLSDEVRQRVRESAGIDEQVSIIDALDALRTMRSDYRLLEGFSVEGMRRLREAAAMFDRLRRAAGQPIPELLRMIEHELRLDIELASNEARGAARTAAAQLRAFTDEVRGFLAVDERGTIGSVLAWLDYAEQRDDMKPRTEPPEPGVVQLLTIHGSKGLEWDHVAVVRLVEDELPGRATSLLGGFEFGRLPNLFRGDARALPAFEWHPPAVIPDDMAHKQEEKNLESAVAAFRDGNREYQRDEERRLAYVAVTRARSALLLTGSYWSGTTKPKSPSTFLTEILAELEHDELPEKPGEAHRANPYDGSHTPITWPLDPLGSRRARIDRAVAAVRGAEKAEPSPELSRLLAEREELSRGIDASIPTRVPASRFKDYVVDFDEVREDLLRPMPERPYRQTRLGTLFHEWVEQRSGLAGAGATPDDALWDIDDEDAGGTSSAEDDRDLSALRATFERSEWAQLQPIAVETEINFSLALEAGSPPHIMICKLDAVYRRGDRIEIVDWKTGRAPRTPQDREDRMLQLAVYRLAYHRRYGVPLEDIDVCLYYVADDLVIRDERAMGEDELVARWRAARRG